MESYGILLIKCSNMPVIYCACILHNMRGYENNLHVMEAEAPSSYGKQADNIIYNYISVKTLNVLLAHLW